MEYVNNKTYICNRKASLFHFFLKERLKEDIFIVFFNHQEGQFNAIGLKPWESILQ